LHNVFGPEGAWNTGKEKAPAALCRKIATANDGDFIDVWGPGNQTRSFLYIDQCIEGIKRIVESDHVTPINLGSERMISINNLVLLIGNIVGKRISINNVPGPLGVMGRNSDNLLIRTKLGWEPFDNLEEGILKTYQWIELQLKGLDR
jgi:nucleoside-diphosphate-sugar epimerase